MSASTAALFVSLLLLTSAICRAVRLYRDMLSGSLDLSNLLACRFDLVSGGMLLLLSSSLPGGS